MSNDAYIGCLLGTAVGDSLGLPYEGLSAKRAAKLFPDSTKHHFVFGKGMVSDDTEHAAFVAQALIHSQGRCESFSKATRSFTALVVACSSRRCRIRDASVNHQALARISATKKWRVFGGKRTGDAQSCYWSCLRRRS